LASIRDLLLEGKYDGDPVLVSVTRCTCGVFFKSRQITKTYKAQMITLEDHSIRIHYSTPGTETNYNGPLFHKLFFEHLMAGNTPSKAFFNTKRDYAPDADTAVEEKILHEFIFYGRL